MKRGALFETLLKGECSIVTFFRKSRKSVPSDGLRGGLPIQELREFSGVLKRENFF